MEAKDTYLNAPLIASWGQSNFKSQVLCAQNTFFLSPFFSDSVLPTEEKIDIISSSC